MLLLLVRLEALDRLLNDTASLICESIHLILKSIRPVHGTVEVRVLFVPDLRHLLLQSHLRQLVLDGRGGVVAGDAGEVVVRHFKMPFPEFIQISNYFLSELYTFLNNCLLPIIIWIIFDKFIKALDGVGVAIPVFEVLDDLLHFEFSVHSTLIRWCTRSVKIT